MKTWQEIYKKYLNSQYMMDFRYWLETQQTFKPLSKIMVWKDTDHYILMAQHYEDDENKRDSVEESMLWCIDKFFEIGE